MSLEKEAAAYSFAKKREFKEALREHASLMELYIKDNLHDSEERNIALRQLQGCVLWAADAANIYGIK